MRDWVVKPLVCGLMWTMHVVSMCSETHAPVMQPTLSKMLEMKYNLACMLVRKKAGVIPYSRMV